MRAETALLGAAAVLMLLAFLPLAEAAPAYRCGYWYKNSAFGAQPARTITVSYAQTACVSLGVPSFTHCYPFYCQASYYGTGYCTGSGELYVPGNSIWSCNLWTCTNSPSCNVPYNVSLSAGTTYYLKGDGVNTLLWYNPCQCTPGATQTGGSCGACNEGTLARTCDSNTCDWGSWVCTGQGNCNNPGGTQACNQCGTQVCDSNTCNWGACTGSSSTTQVKDCDYLDAVCRDYSDCTQTCGSTGNWLDCTCTYTDLADDAGCGTSICSSWYVKNSTDTSANSAQACYSKQPLTSSRCSGGSCKTASSAVCLPQPNKASPEYICGTCQYISATDCSGTTRGSCSYHASGTACGVGGTCDGNGNCNDPVPQASISRSLATVTTTDTFTITATASDSSPGAVSRVEIRLDGSVIKACPISPATATATCSVQVGCGTATGCFSLSSQHTYYAEAWDTANQKATSAAQSFTVVQGDIYPPTISGVKVTDDPAPYYFTYDTTPAISFQTDEQAYCRMSPQDLGYDSISGTGTFPTTTSQGTGHSIALTSPVSGPGPHALYLACSDALGNKHTSADNTRVEFRLDNTSGITSPLVQSRDQDNNPVVTGTAQDSQSNITGMRYKICGLVSNPADYCIAGHGSAILRDWHEVGVQHHNENISFSFTVDWNPNTTQVEKVPYTQYVVRVACRNGAYQWEFNDPDIVIYQGFPDLLHQACILFRQILPWLGC